MTLVDEHGYASSNQDWDLIADICSAGALTLCIDEPCLIHC